METDQYPDTKKRSVGKPLKFATPEKMRVAIDAYLERTPEDELTVTGLALAIGTNRQVLMDYEKREGYAPIVKVAKCIIENSYEIALRKRGKAGDIFALKNFGWKDTFAWGGDENMPPTRIEIVAVDGNKND